MSNSISNQNAKTSILDATIKLKKNMNYLEKFELPLSITQYIDSRLIFNNVNINNPIIISNIEFNLYALHFIESF